MPTLGRVGRKRLLKAETQRSRCGQCGEGWEELPRRGPKSQPELSRFEEQKGAPVGQAIRFLMDIVRAPAGGSNFTVLLRKDSIFEKTDGQVHHVLRHACPCV